MNIHVLRLPGWHALHFPPALFVLKTAKCSVKTERRADRAFTGNTVFMRTAASARTAFVEDNSPRNEKVTHYLLVAVLMGLAAEATQEFRSRLAAHAGKGACAPADLSVFTPIFIIL